MAAGDVNWVQRTVAFQHVYHLSLFEDSALVHELSLVSQNLLILPVVFAVGAEIVQYVLLMSVYI